MVSLTPKDIDLLLLDADGTIRRPKDGRDAPISDPLDQMIMPECKAALKYWLERVPAAIITNQGGVPKYKSHKSCADEQYMTMGKVGWATGFVREIGITYAFLGRGETCMRCQEHYGTSHHHETLYTGNFRKPNIGVWHLIQEDYGVNNPSRILVVGDRQSDLEFSQNLGSHFLWAHDWWNCTGD